MNKLANALSPYLLQHKENPVDWYPWCDEAFITAKKRKIPIFLSIGYAACHWCHVMAHESFEDQEIAAFLNQHFVCIKVDREERPDIDNIYMRALVSMTGQGGWPLNIFLTPEGKPFFGGTYFPNQPRYGQVSFLQLLRQIIHIWENQQEAVTKVVESIITQLKIKLSSIQDKIIKWQDLLISQQDILQAIDFDEGGLQGTPKFPQIALWQWIFVQAMYSNQQQLISACYLTAEKLCLGGIYDHLAGGWMRYSTDTTWLAPHFEKMLYDNALIIDWLTLLYQQRPNPMFLKRIKQTIQWLLAEMYLEEGVFAASLDADSEGEEGKYYVWTWDEIQEILGESAEQFLVYYGCTPEGNWENKNILHLNHRNSVQLPEELIDKLNAKLYLARQQRIRPNRDDKILLDWNALLVSALAKASIVFNQPEWFELAQNLYQSLKNLLRVNGQWCHCYRDKQYQSVIMLEDYAAIIQAAITLYSITGKDSFLKEASEWLEEADKHFSDSQNNLYFQTSKESPDLIANLQPIIDGATPSGNGLMAINLAQLALIIGDQHYIVRLNKLLSTVEPLLHSANNYHISSLCLAVTWQNKGLAIKGNFTENGWQILNTIFRSAKPLVILH